MRANYINAVEQPDNSASPRSTPLPVAWRAGGERVKRPKLTLDINLFLCYKLGKIVPKST